MLIKYVVPGFFIATSVATVCANNISSSSFENERRQMVIPWQSSPMANPNTTDDDTGLYRPSSYFMVNATTMGPQEVAEDIIPSKPRKSYKILAQKVVIVCIVCREFIDT